MWISTVAVFLIIAQNGLCFKPGVAPVVTLSDGWLMPTFGLGTWLGVASDGMSLTPVQDDSVERAVEEAIEAGYRHIDTAALYNTESQVGRAVNKKIAEDVIERGDIFITTKLWNDQHKREKVVPALQHSLQELQTSYVDLYLIHFPVGTVAGFAPDDTDYLETWRGMIDAQKAGLTRSIGVSNFNEEMIERIINETGVVPAVLQIEVHLNLQQRDLLAYCKSRNISVMGYTPFGALFPGKARGAPPPRVDEPALLDIARRHNKTVPQVVLRYLHELGVTPIPKSVTPSRIRENINIFDFHLTEKEKAVLRSYDSNYRLTTVPFWRHHPYYPFKN